MKKRHKRYIYKLTFPNGKVYIGCTCDTKQRWAGAGCFYRNNKKLYQAIQEFGWENIKREIIVEFPETWDGTRTILRIEEELIKAYAGNSYNSMCNPEWHKEELLRRNEKRKPVQKWAAFGEMKPISEWCEQYNISMFSVMERMKKHGLTLEQALTFPSIPHRLRRQQTAREYWETIGLL